MEKIMDVILPDGTKEEVSNLLAHYINCLKNFHMAVECEVERHRIEEQDIFLTIMNIEKHIKDYRRRLTDGLCRGCRKSDNDSQDGTNNETECL